MFSNNSSKASEFVKSKYNYDKKIPPTIDDNMMDIWYDVPYFGKIDTLGTPVYPRENLILSNLDSDNKFQALNFVATAFKSLQSYVNFAKKKKSISADFLGKFTPKKAWQSAPTLFDEYFEQNIYNVFLNNFLNNRTITSFNCFVKHYINFCKTVAEDIPLTFSNFILSNNCSNKISGLIIDLSNDSHDDTKKKIEDYFNDYQYISFLKACKARGFKVNRNAPWQLIADLPSTEMRRYAAAEGINLDDNNLFDKLYYKASSIGYENFKSYLWQMYTDWFSVNTTYSRIKIESKFNSSSPLYSQFITKKINELPVELPGDKTPFLNKYGELYFLKLYFKIRLIEVDMEAKYDILVHYLEDYYNLAGVQGALAFIDKKLTKTNIYTSNEFDPYFLNKKS